MSKSEKSRGFVKRKYRDKNYNLYSINNNGTDLFFLEQIYFFWNRFDESVPKNI
jgi:hypothetical protein